MLVAALVAAGCKPGGNEASPTSAATMAVQPAGQPAQLAPAPSTAG